MDRYNELDLAIVIVNYCSAELTKDCLSSLENAVSKGPRKFVYVVEGGSSDKSADILSEYIQEQNWEDWVELIILEENRGFAFGNNVGIEAINKSISPPEFILLLNPDTYIRPGALHHLVGFMKDNPQVGLAGSRLEHPDGTVQESCFRFHTILSEFDRGLQLGFVSKILDKWNVVITPGQHPQKVDWVAGASLIIRQNVIEDIGYLDDRYFLYFEETDFMFKAAQKGWQTWYVPDSRVVHLVGQSSGLSNGKSRERSIPEYWFNSRKRFFEQNYGHFYAIIAGFFWLVGALLNLIIRTIFSKPSAHRPNDILRFLKLGWLPNLTGDRSS